MPPIDLAAVLQIILALGLINVWLVRSRKATAYRGGASTNLKDEFAAYGLALLAGLWFPVTVVPAALVLTVLMLGAVLMHIKVKDPISKYVPASAMLLMTGALALLKFGQ